MREAMPFPDMLRVTAPGVAAGYLFSCLIATVGLAVLGISEKALFGSPDCRFVSVAFEYLLAGTVFIMLLSIFAFSAFILIRLILWALRRMDWPSFALGGAISSLASGLSMSNSRYSEGHFWELVWRYPPYLWLLLIGALDGAAECLTQRRVIVWTQISRIAPPFAEPAYDP
ncbi:MAG: hypothetical protein ACOH2H_00105 [Cypionkella sp.]